MLNGLHHSPHVSSRGDGSWQRKAIDRGPYATRIQTYVYKHTRHPKRSMTQPKSGVPCSSNSSRRIVLETQRHRRRIGNVPSDGFACFLLTVRSYLLSRFASVSTYRYTLRANSGAPFLFLALFWHGVVFIVSYSIIYRFVLDSNDSPFNSADTVFIGSASSITRRPAAVPLRRRADEQWTLMS